MSTPSLTRTPQAFSLPRPLPGAASIAAAGRWVSGAAALDRSNLMYYGYLVLLVFQYSDVVDRFSILKVSRVAVLLSYFIFLQVVSRVGVPDVLVERQSKIYLTFIVWTMASIAWAVVRSNTLTALRPLIDYFVFMIITVYVIDRRSRVNGMIVTLGLVATYLIARNLGQLLSAARVGGFRAPYFLGDGNDFAWGLNVALPLMLALVLCQTRRSLKLVGLAASAVCLFGIVGTQSRGGTLGLAAALVYGWCFVVRRKAVGVLALVAVAAGVLVVAPSGYFSRMQSVASYDEDNSAQGRLQAWGAAVRMASVYPLGVGAGNFNSAYGRWFNPSTTGQGTARIDYAAARWISAHSTYFKTMGEYGFLGFTLLICLIGANIVQNHRSRAVLRSAPEGAPFDERWPALINMSLVGYAVSGMFLGGLHYPHLFFLSALTMGLHRVVRLERATVPGLRTIGAAGATPINRQSAVGQAVLEPSLVRLQRLAIAAERRRR